MRFIRRIFLCVLFLLLSHSLYASDAESYLNQQASGTALQPTSARHHMLAKQAGRWNLMFHGLLDINAVVQSGPRGEDDFFSSNWFMGTAMRSLGGGTLQFRSMMSLDPLTINDRRYPLLFQTGESAFGEPIVDGQHPHDLFMELSLQYALNISDSAVLHFYFAPVGDPALGPVAFPHRISAAELPQATLSHHLQDSSHIVNEVVGAGFKIGMFDLEMSGFHGAEPDENRWNIDHGAIDSWSVRMQVNPAADWSGQVSTGHLKKPEELEPGDVQRTTASITYNRSIENGGWASSFIYGQNKKEDLGRTVRSFTAESLYQFWNRNYITGRVEIVDKDELFEDGPLAERVFRINAFTAGYTRDFDWIPRLQTGIGANVSFYAIPDAIKGIYGDHPVGAFFYMRIKQKGSSEHHHGGH